MVYFCFTVAAMSTLVVVVVGSEGNKTRMNGEKNAHRKVGKTMSILCTIHGTDQNKKKIMMASVCFARGTNQKYYGSCMFVYSPL